MANLPGTVWQKIVPFFGAPPQWVQIGSVATGPTGLQGAPGNTGQPGPPGAQGVQGVAGSITTTFDTLGAADVDRTDLVAEFNQSALANRTVTVSRFGGYINPQLNDFRLTVQSGVAVPTTDQTSATTLYLTPKFNIGGSVSGNARIAIYDGTRQQECVSGEVSISLSGKAPGVYDVFAQANAGGAVSLSLLAWNALSTGAITGGTAATPIVITSAAHGLANDQLVFISGVNGLVGANGTFRVAGVATNTFNLTTPAGASVAGSGAYTSGGTWWRIDQNVTRATALDLQDGVLVGHLATNLRYVGTIRIVATGLLNDAASQRCVWNANNRVPRHLFAGTTTTTWAYSLTAYRPANNDITIGNSTLQIVIGIQCEILDLLINQAIFNASGSFVSNGVGINSLTATSAQSRGVDSASGASVAVYRGLPGIGSFNITQLEQAVATGTTNWYGFNATSSADVQSGMSGTIWC